MDKNQTIGLLLISLLLLVYFYFFAPKPELPVEQAADTTAVTQKLPETADTPKAIEQTDLATSDSIDLLLKQQQFGAFYQGVEGDEQDVTIENEDLKITFNTKGGAIKEVTLKNHVTYDQKPLILLDAESSQMELAVNSQGSIIDLNQLYYEVNTRKTGSNDTTEVRFTMEVASGSRIEKIYKLPAKGYQLWHQLKFEGLESVIANQDVVLTWHNKIKRLEEHFDGYHGARKKATINYYTSAGSFEDLNPSSDETEQEVANLSIDWVSVKQKFFSAAIIAENGFTGGEFRTAFNPNDSSVVKDTKSVLRLSADVLKGDKGNFQFYFGPNNYQILKKVTPGFSQNVDMGWALFSWINKFIIIPIFNFLENYISNYGIIIIILVLLIKLVLSPLSYKSYISMAKTKVLKPELDELKEKYGNDMQKIQAEQMKLYQQVGVNPLSGCIPVLLQMPILLAMFNFFPNSVELRQESFLWANDLSTYDAILSWNANIPLISFIYGNHISLFTLLMTLSTILYTWSNNQMSAVQGPMKSIGYIMPVMFMFILNSYPAGLTFYYFVSNIVTFGQQYIIRQFVNEEKIRKVLDENRKKNRNKKKSKFQLKIEEAMKASEEARKKR
ncbi:MAG: membrane protein insertase YidC [Cytophagales bacterium]|nr:membrane protein insertase YidC [Cytophagales bacterium]